MASDMGVELGRLERRIAELERNRTFRYVSIDGTTLPVYDADGALRQTIGAQEDGTYTVVDLNGPPPPMPSSPTVQSTIGGLVVVWDGLTATGEPWPRDFKHVEVHLAAVSDYEATNETQVGTLTSLLGGGWTIGGLEPDLIYYASLVAVNTSSKESDPTPITSQTSGTIGVAVDQAVLDQAQEATNQAIQNVRNRPRAYYGAVEPAAPEGGFVSGDQWWREEVDEFGQVSYVGFQWDPALNAGAGGWAPYQFNGSALVANSISAAHILADAIQTAHIASKAIYGEHIVGEQIETTHLGAKAVTADKLAAALVIATTISTGATDADGNLIGQRSEFGPSGIKNIGADGQPNLYFPNDPNDIGFIRAALETWQLRVRGGLAVESSNNEFAADSVTALSAGVSAPSQAAQIESTWDWVAMDTTTSVIAPAETRGIGDFGSFRFNPSQVTGFAWHHGVGKWVAAQQRDEGTRLWFFNEDGTIAQTVSGPWVAEYDKRYEMTVAGSDDATDGAPILLFRQGADWFIHGPVGGTYRFNKLPTGWRLNNSQRPLVAWDKVNKRVLIAENHNAGDADNLVIRRVNMVNTNWGVCTAPTMTTAYQGSGRSGALTGLTFGLELTQSANHYVSASALDMNTTAVTSGAGNAANAAYRWPLAALPRGFGHNGTDFKSLADDGRLYTYTNWTWTDAADKIYARYTWYDSGRGNGITHETSLGRVASITAKKRSKVRITVPVVPDNNGVDDPDKFRLYAARASAEPGRTSLPRIFEGPTVPTTTPTSVIVTSDPAGIDFGPPEDPNPYEFPGANPARLHSGMVDAYGRRKFEVDGFGLGRWPRIMPVGTVLDWTGGGLPPEGWVFADGTAVSRTAYPELAALYWEGGTTYRYGNGDGATTFNLPFSAPAYDDASVTTGVANVADGFSLNWQLGERRGGLVFVSLRVTVDANVALDSMDHINRTVATLTPGWRPPVAISGSFQGAGIRNVAFTEGGPVLLTAGFRTATSFDLVAGDVYDLTATYALPTDPARRVRKIIYAGGNT